MEDRFSVRRMGLRREPIEAADTTCVLERAKNAAIRSNIADGRLCCDASDIIALCVACSHRGDTGDSKQGAGSDLYTPSRQLEPAVQHGPSRSRSSCVCVGLGLPTRYGYG